MRRAFSLIELLVVVAIIAVLAGMLLPTVGLVRESARTSACGSNLRQIGMAYQAYADEQDDAFPAFNAGPSGLSPIYKTYYTNLLHNTGVLEVQAWKDVNYGDVRTGVWRCPGVPTTAMNWGGGYGVLENQHGSPYTGTSPPTPALRRSRVTAGSTRALIADAEALISGREVAWAGFWCPICTPARWDDTDSSQHRGAARHGNGKSVNVAFMDGHVAAVPYLDLKNNVGDIWRHLAP